MSALGPEPATPDGEPLAVVRKKALLRLLGRREADRLGFAAGPEEVAAAGRRFRQHYALESEAEFAIWLQRNGLSGEDFARAMADVVTVEWVEAHHAAAVETLLPSQLALGSARLRLGPER